MVPRSLIMPSLIRLFSPLPYKKQSGKGTSSLSWNWPPTAHLVEDIGPTHLFSCPFLLCKFPPMKPVRFHGIHRQPYRMTGDEHGRTQLTRQSIQASSTVWGTALNMPVKKIAFNFQFWWDLAGRGNGECFQKSAALPC